MKNDANDDKLDGLFAAARKAGLYHRYAEYGFETRVMAKICAAREGQRSYLVWTWRLIPVFVSIIILLGIWIYAFEPRSMSDLGALMGIGSEEAALTALLTGE